MERFCFLLFSMMLLLTLSGIFGEDDPVKHCKKLSRRTIKRLHGEFVECGDALKTQVKSMEEHYEKMGCAVKCVIKKEKMIAEDDKTSEDLLAVSSKTDQEATVYQEKLFKMFKECFRNVTLDPTDEFCRSYGEFGICTQEAVVDVCEEDD